ncbi:hypothetical protein SDC9_173040 [bioreactor metagenome]|uniref:Uncharacterized protein n=1 Tax=bioreactor metagenome TaxID=1076179 RepID=A0A645GFE8_9ZZZZ
MAEGEDQRGDEVCKKVEPSRYWFVAAISSPHHVEDENQQGEEEETQHDLFDDTAVEHGEEQGYEGEGFLGIGSLDLGDPGSEEIVVADHHQCTAKTDQYGNQRLLFRKSERFEQAGSFCKQVPKIGEYQRIDEGNLDDGREYQKERRSLHPGLLHCIDIGHGQIEAAQYAYRQEF